MDGRLKVGLLKEEWPAEQLELITTAAGQSNAVHMLLSLWQKANSMVKGNARDDTQMVCQPSHAPGVLPHVCSCMKVCFPSI